jgi:hypothetical protein
MGFELGLRRFSQNRGVCWGAGRFELKENREKRMLKLFACDFFRPESFQPLFCLCVTQKNGGNRICAFLHGYRFLSIRKPIMAIAAIMAIVETVK